jgi:stalled ribosome alternative rescue factor ArfA
VSKRNKPEPQPTEEKKKDKVISVLVSDPEFYKQIEARAKGLGLNVSQYFRSLAANDVVTRGDLVLRETPAPYGDQNKKPDEGKK